MSSGVCLDEQMPLLLSWREASNPLPLRPIRQFRRVTSALECLAPQGRFETGAPGQAFDFCSHVRRLCADVVERCPELRHIDVRRLLFAVTQARSGRAHGLQARVTPLRFRGGSLIRRRRGVAYQVQRFVVDGSEMLYQVTFCLPRFQDQDFDGKFITIFHELYHISPAFDGDLRRLGGRYAIHSHSKHGYDVHMAQLARAYLATRPDPRLHDFLRLNFAQLCQRHGKVLGTIVPRPKLIPVAARSV